MANEITEKPKYSFNSPCPQNFSVPETILFRLQQSSPILERLYQTCKYFFAQNNILIFHSPNFNDISWLPPSKLPHLNSRLRFFDTLKIETSETFKFFKQLFPKIYDSRIVALHLRKLELKIDELEFLISAKTLYRLSLFIVDILDLEGNRMNLDAIISKLPNITYFFYWGTNISVNDHFPQEVLTIETLENLISQNRVNKFKYFHLVHFTLSPDLFLDLFLEFFNTHGSPMHASFYFVINYDSALQRQTFTEDLKHVSSHPWIIDPPKISFSQETHA